MNAQRDYIRAKQDSLIGQQTAAIDAAYGIYLRDADIAALDLYGDAVYGASREFSERAPGTLFAWTSYVGDRQRDCAFILDPAGKLDRGTTKSLLLVCDREVIEPAVGSNSN